jgi:hypothetical protein
VKGSWIGRGAIIAAVAVALLVGYGCWYWWGYRLPRSLHANDVASIPTLPSSPAARGMPLDIVFCDVSGEYGQHILAWPAAQVDSWIFGTMFIDTSALTPMKP